MGRKHAVKDLTEFSFGLVFTKFSLPDSGEGFDEIRYEWTKLPKKCKEVMEEYKLNRKIITRVEDLTPSAWFHAQWKEGQATLQKWQGSLVEYKHVLTKRAALKAQKNAEKAK